MKLKPMTKLALPDGTSESALLDEDDIANAMVVCDESGRKMILLITKSGEAVFVRHTPNNIAYLETLGLKILSVPSAIKAGLKK